MADHSPPTPSATGTYARIYAVIKRVPRGRVATYGQVAALAGLGGHARPRGEVSPRSEPGIDSEQRCLLEAEGVLFDQKDRVSLARYQWRPR